MLSVLRSSREASVGGASRSMGDVSRDQKMLGFVSHDEELGFFFCQWRVWDGGLT